METRVVWIGTCRRIHQIQILRLIHSEKLEKRENYIDDAGCHLFWELDPPSRRRTRLPFHSAGRALLGCVSSITIFSQIVCQSQSQSHVQTKDMILCAGPFGSVWLGEVIRLMSGHGGRQTSYSSNAINGEIRT